VLRILIADDQSEVRSALKMLLERHEGWTVCGEAADGTQAVKRAVDLKPDIVLLDISMPKLNGLIAAHLIREKNPDSKIIFLTLHDTIGMARIASKTGAASYVTKSLAATHLVPQIEALQFKAGLVQ